jgi:hypothetical protein
MRIRSHCTGHFPPIRFSEGKRFLMHPVSGKLLADRPEERVRLRSIDYFLQSKLWPAGRIASEKSTTTKGKVSAGRIDLVLYDSALEPAVLIECKSPVVSIGDATARQIARYNADINAPTMCMTNGLVDYWYQLENGNMTELENIPDGLRTTELFIPDDDYWRSTGFAGKDTPMGNGLSDLLGVWFSGESAMNLINLNPGLDQTVAGMYHYYQVVQEKGSPVKLAFTLISSDGNDTVLCFIRNINGRNEAVLFLPLDAVYLGKEARARLIRNSIDTEFSLPDHISQYLRESDDGFRSLPIFIDDLFTQ